MVRQRRRRRRHRRRHRPSSSSKRCTLLACALRSRKRHCTVVFPLGRPPVKFVSDNEPGSIPKDLSLRVTAIRETFEESGILLCKKINRHQIDTRSLASHLEIKSIDKWRELVRKSASNFIELCNQNNCYPDVDALHVWSNWLTPPILKTKFDTKFFLALIESPVHASPDGVETSEISVSTS